MEERVRYSLRALRCRNYRLYFTGQGLSLVGTWMQRIALSWLVYRLTDSAAALGLVAFAGQIPTFLAAPVAGVLLDRWNVHRVLVRTQCLAMLHALLLAWLTLSGTAAVWHLAGLSVVLGLINAFDMPARQTFVPQLVTDPQDLPNAIALNSLIVNGARLVGPGLAGVAIGLVGEGACFLINGLSYSAVLVALLAMRVPSRRRVSHARVLDGLRAGFAYAHRTPQIRTVLLLLTFVSLVGMPYIVLMPIIAEEVHGGGGRLLGFLMAASGLGSVAGAVFLAARPGVDGLGATISRAALVFAAALIACGASHVTWVAALVLGVAGFALMIQISASNTLLQSIVDEDKRGRIMSMYAMAFMGAAPFGSLLAGALADSLGASATLVLSGAACMAAAVYFGRALESVGPGFRSCDAPAATPVPGTGAPRLVRTPGDP